VVISTRNYSVLLHKCARNCVAPKEVQHRGFEFLGSIAEERVGSFTKKSQYFLDIANHGGTVDISLSCLGWSGFEPALHFWLF